MKPISFTSLSFTSLLAAVVLLPMQALATAAPHAAATAEARAAVVVLQNALGAQASAAPAAAFVRMLAHEAAPARAPLGAAPDAFMRAFYEALWDAHAGETRHAMAAATEGAQ